MDLEEIIDFNYINNSYVRGDRNNIDINAFHAKQLINENFITEENFISYKTLKLGGKILAAFESFEISYNNKFIFAYFHMYFFYKGI